MTSAAVISGLALNNGETTLEFRFAAGEAGAFDEVVAAYQGRIARLARRLMGWSTDTEDIVQDVFLDALIGATRFRADSSLWTWLSTITVNRCRRRARRASVVRRFVELIRGEPKRNSTSADVKALTDERCLIVRQAVAALPMKEKEVVVLFYLEQRSTAELCQILRVSPNAASVRLHRAREKLAVSLRSLVDVDLI